MKILVVFTGGTIGSSVKKGWANVDSDTQYALLKNFENNRDIEFVILSPYSVLSENLSANELNILQKEIAQNITRGFDGIIVTHGTDSLQYTSAAMEYSFNGCAIPIVFVSAAHPLEDDRTNGYINFEAAVEFIKAKIANGVFASYKNSGEENVNIHIASRILQHGEYASDIYSLGGIPFAQYNGERIVCNEKIENSTGNIGVVEYVKNPGILSVESYPGNDYSYCLDNVKAVILKPYHSGTLDTANECLRDFCIRAKAKNIPLFITNSSGDVEYQSKEVYGSFGINSVPFSTYISTYMKVWAAISLGKDIVDFVMSNIAREFANK